MHFQCSVVREEAEELSHDELCFYQGGKPFGLASDFLLRWLIWCEWEIKKFLIEILDLLPKHWRLYRPEVTGRNRPQRKQSQVSALRTFVHNTKQDSVLTTWEGAPHFQGHFHKALMEFLPSLQKLSLPRHRFTSYTKSLIRSPWG